MTGETGWFRFPCGDGAIDGIQHPDTKEEAPNALCFANNSAGYRKEVMSEISLSKVNGINSDCYYLSVQGPVGAAPILALPPTSALSVRVLPFPHPSVHRL